MSTQDTTGFLASNRINHDRYSSVVTDPSELTSEALPASNDSSGSRENQHKRKILFSSFLKPLALFLVAALLALGHHIFNVFADRKSINTVIISQEWMSRVGTAFAVGFQTSLSVSLSFVLCQIMWLTLKGELLTLSEIDNVYLSAGRDILATYCSSTLYKSPLLVLTVSISFLLAIPTVFTPSSLRVVARTSLNPSKPCQIPTGNLTNGGPGSILYVQGSGYGASYWNGITPVAQKLAYSTLVGQKIPLLPRPAVCGSSCSYVVTVPSIAFQCQEITYAELPRGMHPALVLGPHNREETFWNVTVNSTKTDPDPEAAFWVYWHSTNGTAARGTDGLALCTVGTATYDFNIQILNGTQSIEYRLTHTGGLPHSYANLGRRHLVDQKLLLQLTSLASAIRAPLLGTISTLFGDNGETPRFNSPVMSAGFFDPSLNSGHDLTWKDVPRGIEELSHNVSAAILTMDLGMRDANCEVISQEIVYEYDRLNLWVPYGTALLVLLSCLILGISVFLKHNPENLTPSFSHTVGLTRNLSLNGNDIQVVGKQIPRYMLGELKDGSEGFGMPEDLNSR